MKTAAEVALLRSGAGAARRATLGGQTLILAYHNVLPRGAQPLGDRSLHLPQAEFAAQLDLLTTTHEVVPLAEIFERRASHRPRAVITFDDAYRGAVEAGVEELARRSLPATIFVAPAFLGGRDFWWDALVAPGAAVLDPRLRALALREMKGSDDHVRTWAMACGRPLRMLPRFATVAEAAELEAATRRTGITLGSHSWSHANLASLDADELRAELVRPLIWLRERFERAIPWLSYPYGLLSDAVVEAAGAAGYAGALRIEGGWSVPADADRFRLPRLNVSAGLSRTGFALRAAGLLCG